MDGIINGLLPQHFMPHGHCYLWQPQLLWMFILSDSVIAISYFTIPLAFIYLIKKRIDLEFNWVFIMFSLFIFACGTTHLISIVTIWHPLYWLDASVKSITAIASLATAVMLWRLMPVALTITSNKQLKNTIVKLETEIQKRQLAEQALAELNANLEQLVIQRTNDLSVINENLRAEIVQRKKTEEALFNQQQLAMVTLESIGDAVITTDLHSVVTYLNPVAEKMTGWTKAEAQGRPILEVFRILNESTRKLAANPVDVVLAHNKVCGLANHTVLISKSGHEFAIEDSAAPIRNVEGEMLGVVLVFHDVSDARQMAQKMTYLAEHDYLTDLPNRLLLTDRITQAIHAAKRRSAKLAILFFDIDHFKRVNDTLGHEVGDQLLKILSTRLKNCIRGADTLSRQGGDEFVVLLPELQEDAVPAEMAQKILEAVKLPIQIHPHELSVTASIGIAVYPDDGDSVDELTRHADAAMYHAKSAGRNQYQFFTQEMSARVAAQLLLENSLKKAISNQELVLYYQPKVCLKTGNIIGAEALIRWQHPEWGLIMPDRFIPIAEDSGLIKNIGNWVLREACTQNKRWQDAGLPKLPIAINVSVVELNQNAFMQEITRVLMQTGLQPHYLELEVTESVAIQGQVSVIQDLNALKDMGVRLSVDDFGTGYSSLSYLKMLPVNTIKIDKSFIRDIQIDLNDAAIVTAIIKMSQSLGLTVIAEGVETPAQLAFLKAHDCDEMQGYLFSKPLDAEAFADLIAHPSDVRKLW